MAIKIEEGKYYRTRDGRKVGPMSVWRAYTDEDGGPLFDCEGGEFSGNYWSSDGSNGEPDVINDPDFDLIAEWGEGPVRTVTRKEIVPGTYGVLSVKEVAPWHSGDAPVAHVCIPPHHLPASELRAAAATFIELADALDEVPA